MISTCPEQVIVKILEKYYKTDNLFFFSGTGSVNDKAVRVY